MNSRRIHLVCNAHLDPAWLWELEEGAAEALSTFRIAADFCEQYDGFVFNHNEAILYQWVEEYDPELFKRIQRLVQQGRWSIMGGWYLQPDCNMPSGESLVRQILTGRRYFREKFGVEPKTAINFDPFGHSRGLVQILHKSGYDSYVFCRPAQNDCPLPSDDFIWVGYDGSEVMGHRAFNAYLSGRGKARTKVENWIDLHTDKAVGMVLWGIGNHGGGPSKIDLDALKLLMEETPRIDILHSTTEAYFNDLRRDGSHLPKYSQDLNPWAVGCYTSQIRIKQRHRQLENELFFVEKMVSSAAIQGYLEYPKAELGDVLRDLMVAEFHDILPGSSIQAVEDNSLRMMDHGLELLARLKSRAFFALTSRERVPLEGEVPVFVYNPHPFPVCGVFECEFQLPQGSKDKFANVVLFQHGSEVPCQVEKEWSNIGVEWRKRVAFYACLHPAQMNRFDCKVEFLDKKPPVLLEQQNQMIVFTSNDIEVIVNCESGLIDSYKVHGVPYLEAGAFRTLVIEDNDDSWGCRVHSFRNVCGSFRLSDPEAAAQYSGIVDSIPASVRIIEDGPVRTVIESILSYGNSFICQTYLLPKHGTQIEVRLLVHWNEKSKMLKLAIPSTLKETQYIGQVAYGVDNLPHNGREVVAQKWVGLVSDTTGQTLTCVNDGTYGSDCDGGEIRLSLLRSPGYSALPSQKEHLLPQDRFSNRMDQGERTFRFWINAGPKTERLTKIGREALAHNERPYLLSYFPNGRGRPPHPLVTLSDEAVELTTFKQEEDSEHYILRLFEPTGEERNTTVVIPPLGVSRTIHLLPFEIKTLRLDLQTRELVETEFLKY